MNNQPPIRESAGDQWSGSWAAWFQNVFDCLRWKQSFNYTFAVDFPSVPANSQSSAIDKTIPGVRQGDAVQVTPLSDASGIVFKGIVTANDTVSLYACNFTAGSINPSSNTLRVVVLQN